MTFEELIRRLMERDVKLIPQVGGGLDVDLPRWALTAELLDALRQYKPVILRRMRAVERAEGERVCRRLDRLIDPVPRRITVHEQRVTVNNGG
jgi:hypothetical protein